MYTEHGEIPTRFAERVRWIQLSQDRHTVTMER